MVRFKIISNNIKLVKLWFFIKFMNFSKNSKILTQAKASYLKVSCKFSEFFYNSIKNYEFVYIKLVKNIDMDYSPPKPLTCIHRCL